jgi:hypothetical protein
MTTPTISGVSGTIANGQTLTISGANMLNEATSTWIDFFKNNPQAGGFEGTTPDDGWPSGQGSGWTHDTSIKLFGTKSIKNHSAGFTNGVTPSQHSAPRFFYTTQFGSVTTCVWVRQYVRFSGITANIWPDLEHKMCGVWNVGPQEAVWSYRTFGSGAPMNGMVIWMKGTVNDHYEYPGMPWDVNKWYCVEVKFPKHGVDSRFQCYINNQLIVDDPNVTGTSQGVSMGTGGWMEFETNWYATPANFTQDQWKDGMGAKFESRVLPACVVEISNNATYASGTKVYQFPTTLSETSSQVTCDLTGLGAGPYYLWVTNNLNQRSSAFNLSGGAPTVPSAPVNLRIVPSTPTQTVFFTENFTDNNFAARGWYDSTTGTIDTSVFSPGGGSSSLKISWGAGATTPATPTRHLFTATDSVYLNFWVKFGTASVTWQGSPDAFHPHIFQLLTDSDNDFIGPAWTHLSARFEIRSPFTPRFNFQDGQRINVAQIGINLLGTSTTHAIAGGNGPQNSANSTYWFDGVDYWNDSYYDATTPVFVNNTWHHVECYVAMNSVSSGVPVADGVVRYTIDGVDRINRTNVYLRPGQYATQKFNKLLLVPYIGSGSPIAQDMWIDNLIVANRP